MIWTAAAVDVPVLTELDMSAPASGFAEARAAAAELEPEIERELRAYAPRSNAASLRKRVR